MAKMITIKASTQSPIEKVWKAWNDPAHVTQWNAASPDWHSPRAENDFTENGKFNYRMEAKDGSFGFDFSGVYDEIVPLQKIRFHLDDNRQVEVEFESTDSGVHIVERFEPETQNPEELQQAGWQAILDSFVKYVDEKM